MKLALEELGYSKVYHFFEVAENPSHTQLWIQAMEAKFGQNKAESNRWTSSDWHSLLQGYNAVTDIPAACFALELVAAYPNAKIILMTRSPESWQISMLRTIGALHSSRFVRLKLLFSDQETKSLFRLLERIVQYYFHGINLCDGVKVFEDHNKSIRKLAHDGNRDFLEFSLGEGWDSLCQFLGKSVPETDFPHVNDSESFRKSFGLGWGSHTFTALGVAFLLLIGSIFYKLST
ncbi:hypothetical protein EG329_005925 [Mollisiaceae sp. DMI_Dod_QoI]|nr:hypothetical protein EG329_005925 [Helotiales sp. DMI_Dod_QoI]